MKELQEKYTLPEGWIWTSIGEISILSSGGTPDRGNRNYFNGNIPWVKSGELNHNIILDTAEKISDLAIEHSSAKIIPSGTLLIALYGSTVGKLAFLGVPAATNQAVASLITTDSLEKKYLYYYLLINRDRLLQMRIGGAQPNISQKILSNFRIPIPMQDEQLKIVLKIEELLSSLEKSKEQLKEVLQKLAAYQQSILKTAFKSSNFSNFKKLNKILLFIGSGTTPKGGKQVYVDEGIIFLRSQNIQRYKLSLTDVAYITPTMHDKMRRSQINPFDVLLNITGASIGRCTYIPEGFKEANVNQHVCILRPDLEKINHKFLSLYLNSPNAQNNIMSIQTGATRQGLNYSQIREISVPMPSLEEQEKIVQHLEQKSTIGVKLSENIKSDLVRIENLRKAILLKAFNGELVEQNNNKEDANIYFSKLLNEKKSFINKVNEDKKKNPKIKVMVEKLKSIIEILEATPTSISASELWSLSEHRDNIDGFYAELKKLVEVGSVIEVIPRKGKESFLKLVSNHED